MVYKKEHRTRISTAISSFATELQYVPFVYQFTSVDLNSILYNKGVALDQLPKLLF